MKLKFIFLLMLGFSAIANAGEVLDDQPIKYCPTQDPLTGEMTQAMCPKPPYIELIIDEEGNAQEPQPLPGPIPEEALLPVHSKLMSVGSLWQESSALTPEQKQAIVLNRTYLLHHKSSINRPLFVVGNDDYSYRWLVANKEKLKKAHAQGIMVQVETIEELNRMRSVDKDLEISAGPGDGIVHTFDESSGQVAPRIYPILITKYFFEQ